MQHHIPIRSRRARAVLAGVAGLATVAGLTLVGPSISAAPRDPGGANGTVKIDGEPFDTHPNNEPHVGCLFEVDFYGFDEGDHVATVEFTAQPPTGAGETLTADEVFVGEDAAGGGTDLDAERSFDLGPALAAYDPHPDQGYHVKVTVAAPGRGGKVATKHKVLWVEGCGTTPPPCEETPQGCGNPE